MTKRLFASLGSSRLSTLSTPQQSSKGAQTPGEEGGVVGSVVRRCVLLASLSLILIGCDFSLEVSVTYRVEAPEGAPLSIQYQGANSSPEGAYLEGGGVWEASFTGTVGDPILLTAVSYTGDGLLRAVVSMDGERAYEDTSSGNSPSVTISGSIQ